MPTQREQRYNHFSAELGVYQFQRKHVVGMILFFALIIFSGVSMGVMSPLVGALVFIVGLLGGILGHFLQKKLYATRDRLIDGIINNSINHLSPEQEVTLSSAFHNQIYMPENNGKYTEVLTWQNRRMGKLAAKPAEGKAAYLADKIIAKCPTKRF